MLSYLLNDLTPPIPNTTIHSHLTQKERLENLEKFRKREVPMLIATDVAGRGLDLEGVEAVIHWGLPVGRSTRKQKVKVEGVDVEKEEIDEEINVKEPNVGIEEYIHRVGRTARIRLGKRRGGISIAFVSPAEVLPSKDGGDSAVELLERRIGKKLEDFTEELREDKVLVHLNAVGVGKRMAAMRLDEEGFGERERVRREKRKAKENVEEGNIEKRKKKKREK
jgi:ATP-dependent RNA helicase DDX49/DBP8